MKNWHHSDKELSLLQKMLQERRYEETFQLCRQLREQFKRSPPAELLFAGSCALFGLGHIHQAGEWVEALKTGAGNSSLYLYPAAWLELHRGQFNRALLFWTAIVQADPSQVFADSLIERLKNREAEIDRDINRPEAFSRYVPLTLLEAKEQGEGVGGSLFSNLFVSLFTRLRYSYRRRGWAQRGGSAKPAFGLLASLAIAALGAAAIFYVTLSDYSWRSLQQDIGSQILGNGGGRSAFSDERLLPLAPTSGTVVSAEQYSDERPRFIFADRQAALEAYNRARSLILKKRVNQARYILGKLELSNASFEIKERALLLRSMIPTVPRDQFNDPLHLPTAEAESYIYRDAQILWRGEITSLQHGDETLRFRLLPKRGEDREIIALYSPGREGQREPEKLQLGAVVEIFGHLRRLDGDKLLVEVAEYTKIR